MAENPLLQLVSHGQSVWLDNLTRTMIQDGTLDRRIAEDGLSGITSNPAIFEKAISGSEAYDGQIRELADSSMSTVELFEALAIRDIQGATDKLRGVFDATGGDDGYVSLEVSPHLARDTGGTIDEAERLWKAVDRPNLFIKIPGTPEGVPAVAEALARGINVNITLLFSLDAYRDVMGAHLEALERRVGAGEDPGGVASVASFFLSRIDVMIDEKLDAMVEAGEHAEEAAALRGRAAVASAKLAYRLWKGTYSGPRWQGLEAAGARVQKPLWASTSTKDPSYPDLKYVEPLIGPRTVNTMPDSTLDAFRDHGRAAVTVEEGLDEAENDLRRLAAIGIDLDRVTDALVEEGIEKFIKPFDSLLRTLEQERARLAAAGPR